MTFIVEPQREEKGKEKEWHRTMCVLCSEDPRWCPPEI